MQKSNIQKIIDQLLANRGFKNKKKKELFFNPKNPQEVNIEELEIEKSELKKSIARIEKAVKGKELIIVYGDYDVDGICAAAIIWETLDVLGARALPYIPSRFTEGYGLSKIGIENLLFENPEVSLIITVDSGIVANEGVDFAKEKNLGVIITDHHQKGEDLPKADAIIHTTKLSGSAVAWFLAKALLQKQKTENRKQKLLSDHLGLAALGTISDVLPLTNFNRSIVVYGLRELRNTNRLGLKALYEETQIKQEDIDTYQIGFMISPRINAAGRIEHAMDSLRLLCTKDPGRAKELARKLGATNRLRQEKTELVVKHVDEFHGENWKNGNLPKLLFVHHENYEEGVIGIAAGRLVDQYHRPAIVVSQGEELSKASARSVPGVNIVDLIKSAGSDFFKSVGGHPMAAGFTIPTEKLELLALRLTEIAENEIAEDLLVKNIKYDLEINFEDISSALYSQLLQFQPFGFGNPEPTFKTKNVQIIDARLVGKEETHLKLTLAQKSQRFEAIAFKMGKFYPEISPNKEIEIIYAIDMNEWNNKRNLQLKVRNIKLYKN